MSYARLETATLADVDDSYYYGAECRSCHHSSRLGLERLRSVLGPDYPLTQLRSRLKCRQCGSRQITISFLAPNQAVGDLARLFQQPAL